MSQLDISELIRSNLDVLALFFDHVSDMVFLMSVEPEMKFRYLMINPTALYCSGLGKDAHGRLIEDVIESDIAGNLNEKYTQVVMSGKPLTYIDIHDGVYGETILTPIFDGSGVCTHVFAVTRDVTARHLAEQELQYLAYHDTLTGLPNRRLFQERWQAAIQQAEQNEFSIALLFIDCDLFKSINDRHGHDVGDEFLRVFSLRLQHTVREADTIARLGGDEFVIFLQVRHSDEAKQVGQRVLDSVLQPWKIGTHEFETTVSVGIAIYPEDGRDSASIIRCADRALYKAKSTGRNAYVLSDECIRTQTPH